MELTKERKIIKYGSIAKCKSNALTNYPYKANAFKKTEGVFYYSQRFIISDTLHWAHSLSK